LNLRFRCTSCGQSTRLADPRSGEWKCPACEKTLRIPEQEPGGVLASCLICGNKELYKQKDFPHALGLAILACACLASMVPYALYMKWLTWAILLGSAAFDGLLYLLVGDVLVCYRCGAQYRGCRPGHAHQPFELGIQERYRQEQLRREQLRQGQ